MKNKYPAILSFVFHIDQMLPLSELTYALSGHDDATTIEKGLILSD